ncbi:hypothetical protein HanPI659440_Chr06g0235731 [Helianthus annuus]|nr:hypothetical protein HanHA89_Chr10g0393861 [Helianthus annuus]KAJ0780269.1 hypothetical protein HanPI659440_Chr06g0235731 [Helianthus annuus]KAJ0781792.1 hypothetical protein HanLR1_Chr01g0000851 [Helianthus annuus]
MLSIIASNKRWTALFVVFRFNWTAFFVVFRLSWVSYSPSLDCIFECKIDSSTYLA